MQETLKQLDSRVTQLLQRYEAAKKEVKRLQAALKRQEKLAAQTESKLKACEDAILLATISSAVPQKDKPAMRKTLDSLIGEIDNILKNLND